MGEWLGGDLVEVEGRKGGGGGGGGGFTSMRPTTMERLGIWGLYVSYWIGE